MSGGLASTRDVALEMDALPIKALHVVLALVCGLGLAFDIFEMALGGVLSAVFSAPPNTLAAGSLAWLLSSVFWGAIVGAPALGWVADRFGRRTTLALALFCVGAFSLAAVLGRSALELSVLRALAGIGLGAYPPVMMAYLTDQLPPPRRGSVVLSVTALAALALPGAAFTVRALTPLNPLGLEGWRWAFALGGAGALLTSAAFIGLPESPRWLDKRGRSVDAARAYTRFAASRTVGGVSRAAYGSSLASVGAAPPSSSRIPRQRLVTSALSLLAPWITAALPLISGAVLMQKGFKLPDTLLFIGLGSLGPTLSSLVAAPLIDRLERRVSVAVLWSVAFLASAAFIASSAPTLVVASYFAFGFFSAPATPALALYVAEAFPTAVRAHASSTAWAMNRLGSATAPLILLPMVRTHGPASVLALIALLLLVGLLLLTRAARGNEGRPVG